MTEVRHLIAAIVSGNSVTNAARSAGIIVTSAGQIVGRASGRVWLRHDDPEHLLSQAELVRRLARAGVSEEVLALRGMGLADGIGGDRRPYCDGSDAGLGARSTWWRRERATMLAMLRGHSAAQPSPGSPS